MLLSIFLVACQSSVDESTNQTSTTETPSSASSEVAPADSAAEKIEPGMNMADVKKIKGAPDDTAHEHGEGGSEVDIWKYKDGDVKFVNGKVSA